MPIFPSRLHLAVAVLVIVISGTALTGVVTGIPRERADRLGARQEVKDTLQGRLDSINKLHSELTDGRKETLLSLDQLQRIADLIRSPGGVGIPEAHAGWAAAKEGYVKARTSLLGDKASLEARTKDLVSQSKEADDQIARLLGLLDAKADTDYLSALDRAYELLVDAHTAYLEVYEELEKAMPSYEALYEKTDVFLAEEAQGKFKSKKDASTIYVLRTNDVMKPLVDMRAPLTQLAEAAVRLERKASAAFKNAATLRGKTGGS